MIYHAVHANVHGLPAAVQQAASRADVLALNESRPVETLLDRMKPGWDHRRAASNAITWRTSLFDLEGMWHREVLEEKPGRFGWQSSVALAVLLTHKPSGERMIHVTTHWPSKAWTVWPWRRKAWRRAKHNTRLFVDAIQENHNLEAVPVLLSLDSNNGGEWGMYRFRTVADPHTFGRGRYDRWLARGAITISDVQAFRTVSDHKAVAVKVTSR